MENGSSAAKKRIDGFRKIGWVIVFLAVLVCIVGVAWTSIQANNRIIDAQTVSNTNSMESFANLLIATMTIILAVFGVFAFIKMQEIKEVRDEYSLFIDKMDMTKSKYLDKVEEYNMKSQQIISYIIDIIDIRNRLSMIEHQFSIYKELPDPSELYQMKDLLTKINDTAMRFGELGNKVSYISSSVHYLLAETIRHNNEGRKIAIDLLVKAISLNVKYNRSRILLSYLYTEEEKYQDALSCLEESDTGESISATITKARIYSAMKIYDKSMKYATKAFDLISKKDETSIIASPFDELKQNRMYGSSIIPSIYVVGYGFKQEMEIQSYVKYIYNNAHRQKYNGAEDGDGFSFIDIMCFDVLIECNYIDMISPDIKESEEEVVKSYRELKSMAPQVWYIHDYTHYRACQHLLRRQKYGANSNKSEWLHLTKEYIEKHEINSLKNSIEYDAQIKAYHEEYIKRHPNA